MVIVVPPPPRKLATNLLKDAPGLGMIEEVVKFANGFGVRSIELAALMCKYNLSNFCEETTTLKLLLWSDTGSTFEFLEGVFTDVSKRRTSVSLNTWDTFIQFNAARNDNRLLWWFRFLIDVARTADVCMLFANCLSTWLSNTVVLSKNNEHGLSLCSPMYDFKK